MPEPAWPRLERTGPDRGAIVRGDKRLELAGPGAAAILARHEHMLTHGETEARIYLMGVLDGLQENLMRDALALLRDVQAQVEKGKRLVAEHRERKKERGGA